MVGLVKGLKRCFSGLEGKRRVAKFCHPSFRDALLCFELIIHGDKLDGFAESNCIQANKVYATG